MDSDFGHDYIGYESVRDGEGGLHNGRGNQSSGTNRFMIWAFAIMMAVFGLIGVIAHFTS